MLSECTSTKKRKSEKQLKNEKPFAFNNAIKML